MLLTFSLFSLFSNYPNSYDLIPSLLPCDDPRTILAIEAAITHLAKTVLDACIARQHPDERCIKYFSHQLEYIFIPGHSACPELRPIAANAQSFFVETLRHARAVQRAATTAGRQAERRLLGALRASEDGHSGYIESLRPVGEPLSYGFGLRVPWTHFQVQGVTSPGQAWTGRVAYVDYEVEAKKGRLFKLP
jgi:hypothetical protein